ncbi:MFS transporter [Accumulibacter sp.]|uniref:MFS transporter n=1 Tax=Accumulibacter sp. TaxID=2053492 RepID=UPI0025FB4790|nr:MFS transporter [Accumulibacter sp.]MCM8610937.1 MFS transporter [Accumulibacter sp.]MCM8634757.1 MFS transporter [Accumulibacter sp.]MCM8638311.1 MFS transporter [Accumulibacter sp.]
MNAGHTLAYGLLGLPLAFAALPIYVHVPRLYAEVAGLELALLGAILLGTRLLDAGIDPWLGWLADRVPRPTMVALALVPFAAGFVALLNPPIDHAALWLAGSLALTYLGFSAASVAYQAWGADVGANSAQRTRLTAAREGFGLLGVVLAAALPALLASDLGEGIRRLSWILPPLLLLAAATTFSRVGAGQPVHAPRQPLLPSLRLILGDRAFRRLLGVFIANGVAAALPATLFLFFVADVLQLERASGPLLASYFVAGAASLPLWVRLAACCGRVVAWLAAMGLSIIAFAGASLLGAGDLWPFAAICVASGLALGADLALPAAIAADLGERQGQAGACFGVWNFIAKLNLALAAGLALPLLALLGYVPGGGDGLSSLTFAYALLPLAFKALAAALLWRWRHSLEI